MPLIRALRRPFAVGVSRTVALLSLLAATGPAVLGVAPGTAVAAPSYTLAERALAIASPSLVYLETVYTGYVRDKQTKQPVLASPITYNRRCSGFVVNSGGDVVTTRICVAPPDETIRQQVLRAAGTRLVGEKKLDRAQLDAWVASHMSTTSITGLSDDSKPDVKLFAQFNIATGAITDKPAVKGTVVKSSDPDDGNVALVKLDQGNLPAAETDTNSTLSTGSQVTVLGFNTTDSDTRVGTYTLDSQSVQVVGSDKLGAATYYRLNKTVGTYYHGGMAIDASGRVVGIVDQDPTLSNNQNRAVYPVSTITPVLAAAGVHNTLGASDKLFRSGLDAYFNGRYPNAISDLDKAAKAVPTNKVAPQYRQNAVDRQKIEGNASSGIPGWEVLVIAAVGGALMATAIVLVALRSRSRRRSRRQRDTDWEPRYPYPPAPARPLNSSDVPWATAFGPVSAPPTSAPPAAASLGAMSPTSAPPVSSPSMYVPPPDPPPYQPDMTTTQPVSWPPADAIPMMPEPPDLPTEFVPGPVEPAPAPTQPTEPVEAAEPAESVGEAQPQSPFAPAQPVPPFAPVAPVAPVSPAADGQPTSGPPDPTETIVWQQKPTRRSLIPEDLAEDGDRPISPWAAPPPGAGPR